MSNDTLTITLKTDKKQNVENAIRAVEAELGVEVDKKRGPIAGEKISVGRAIEEMAIAYTGYDTNDV